MELPDKNIELPEPWYWTDQDLSDQLNKEIGKDHILYGQKVKTLARRQDNDDVLFYIGNNKFAVVHLTWGSGLGFDSRWPQTKIYNDWQDVFVNRIMIDKQEFE